MWSVEIGGWPVKGKSLKNVLTHLAEDCRLTWEFVEGFDDPPTAQPYVGPVLEAPKGMYNLDQTGTLYQLMVADDQVFLDGVPVAARGGDAIPRDYLAGLRDLFMDSEKLLYLYKKDNYYDVVMHFPGTDPEPEHPRQPGFKLLGRVDLVSGKVVPCG